jgi:hypothetical protein
MLFKAVASSTSKEIETPPILGLQDKPYDFNLYVLKYKNLLRKTDDEPETLIVKIFIHKKWVKKTVSEQEIVCDMRLIFARMQKENHPVNGFGKVEIYLKDAAESMKVSQYYSTDHDFYPGAIGLNLKFLFKNSRPNPFQLGGVLYREHLDETMRVLLKELSKKELLDTSLGKSFYQLNSLEHPVIKNLRTFFQSYIFLKNISFLFNTLSEIESERMIQNLMSQKKFFDTKFSKLKRSRTKLDPTQELILKIWNRLSKVYEIDRFFSTISRSPS